MKIKSIGLRASIFFMIASVVSFGQDGSETDEDHCQEKFNALKSARNAMAEVYAKRDETCRKWNCAKKQEFWLQIHGLMGLCSDMCDAIVAIVGNLTPDVSLTLKVHMSDLVAASYGSHHSLNAAFSGDLRQAALSVLGIGLSDLSAEQQQKLNDEINSFYAWYSNQLNKIQNVIDQTKTDLKQLDDDWLDAFEDEENAISEIMAACDPNFNRNHHNVPSFLQCENEKFDPWSPFKCQEGSW